MSGPPPIATKLGQPSHKNLRRRPVSDPFQSNAGCDRLSVIKDFRNYDIRTRHTNADLADAVRIEDLRQAAVFMAVMTWQAAMRDEPIPRQKR